MRLARVVCSAAIGFNLGQHNWGYALTAVALLALSILITTTKQQETQ